MSLKASIDIGSNSILLLIMDIDTKIVLREESRLTFLGNKIDITKEFGSEAVKSSYDAFSDYRIIIDSFHILDKNVIVTATEAARVATNALSFFLEVKKRYRFSVIIINAKGESYFTAKGQDSVITSDEAIIMDMGGASTELIHYKKIDDDYFFLSLPIGASRAYDWNLNSSLKIKIFSILKSSNINHFFNLINNDQIDFICVAGTMTSIAGMLQGLKEFDQEKINNNIIKVSSLKVFLDKLNGLDIKKEFAFIGKREKNIKDGLEAAIIILEYLKIKQIKISTKGLIYGTINCAIIDKKYKS